MMARKPSNSIVFIMVIPRCLVTTDAGDRALVRIGGRVRTVEDASLAKQPDTDAGTFPLADLRAKLNEQRLDAAPLDVGADRPVEDQVQRPLVLAFHESNSTE